MPWTPEEDKLLISLLYTNAHGFLSRGSQSWHDLALTMSEQAAGYGFPVQEYTAESAQQRWYELRPQHEQQEVNAAARRMVANRETLLLPPMVDGFETDLEPEREVLEGYAGAAGPARGFEELCERQKAKGTGVSEGDRKGKGREK